MILEEEPNEYQAGKDMYDIYDIYVSCISMNSSFA